MNRRPRDRVAGLPLEILDAGTPCRGCARPRFVDGCARLVRGDYTDAGLITALGREGAAKFFDGREHEDTYWFRVWGARGLLWAWDDSATPALLAAFGDEAWRVREMAAKVPRVRAAAQRAVARLTANTA